MPHRDPATAPSDGCSMEPSLQNADAATGQGSPWGVYLGFLDPQSGSFTFTIPTPPSPGDYYLQSEYFVQTTVCASR